MLIELFSEVTSDLYPIYFYLSIIITVMFSCANVFVSHHHIKKYQAVSSKSCFVTHSNGQAKLDIKDRHEDTRSWIAKKLKRKDGPDDDEDNYTFSSFYKILKLRGGTSCLTILHSLFSRNIRVSY